MLGLFGLFGALLAGMAADALMNGMDAKSDTDDDAVPPDGADEPEATDDASNMLDWLGFDEDMGDTKAEVASPENFKTVGPDDPDYVAQSGYQGQTAEPGIEQQGGDLNDLLSGLGGEDTLSGAGGDDQLTGRDGHDFIQGGSGDDIAHGGAGADTLQGGSGNDLLVGQDGDDKLVGGAGADTLLGHEGDDSLYGGAGADTLTGGGGADQLVGGDADDWLAGGLGDDALVGDAGSDTLDGGAGNDVLDGRDPVDAFPEMDFLNGGEGDDVLRVGAGDHATGGDGSDWFELSDMATGDAIANIADYDAAEDRLVVVFDPTMHPDPHLSLQTQDDTDDVIVLLDGVPLATVQGGAGMTLADVLLTPAQAA